MTTSDSSLDRTDALHDKRTDLRALDHHHSRANVLDALGIDADHPGEEGDR